jgi:predicted lipoprotein with Yx(FWY)xxD motif
VYSIITSPRSALVALIGAGALTIAACGGDPAPVSAPAELPPVPVAVSVTPATAAPVPVETTDAAVKISQTPLGDVLSDADGKTLYAFVNDVDAISTCYGTCAEAWPPVLVDPDFVVSPGLDSGIFATTRREDGSFQLVAGKYPLYLFAADAKPGDITGQASGDVWFAVDLGGRIIVDPQPDGSAPTPTSAPAPVEAGGYGESAPVDTASVDAAPSPQVQLAESELGTILTDAGGLTLYLFTPDDDGSPTCVDTCAQTWPPLLIDDAAELLAGEGIDATMLSTIEHPNGGMQLKFGKWPLYAFTGDAAPGDVTGQGSGDNWFVVGPDAKPIK